MNTKAPPVDLAQLAADIRPLADFYRAAKPDLKVIRLFPEQYRALEKSPVKAARFGFKFHGKQIQYAEFTLLSETQNV